MFGKIHRASLGLRLNLTQKVNPKLDASRPNIDFRETCLMIFNLSTAISWF